MTNIWILLKIQLLGFFGLNKVLESKDDKEKMKYKLFAFGSVLIFIVLGFVSFLYSNAMATSFKMLGDIGILLSIMLVATCSTVLITTVYKVNGILFGYKDYDMIIALPVTIRQIVGSRILMLYVMNILFSLLIMLPCGIAFAIHTLPNITFYILFIITLILIPLVPIIIATAIGAIITMVAAKFKYINIISIILSIAFLLGVMYLSMGSGNITNTDIVNISKSLNEMIYRVYPLAKFYTQALVEYNFISFLLFIVISLGSFIVFTMFISINYRSINTLLSTTKTKSNYKMGALIGSTQLGALYKKEFKRYISSSLYVMNTSFGVILLLIFSIALLVVGAGPIEQVLEMPGFAVLINKASPLIVSMFIIMSCTTGSSISLEGKHIWIAKSIPVDASTIFLSKIAVNLSLTIPVIFISSTLLSIKLQPSFLQMIMLYITPMVYAVFSATAGIVINLLFPVLEWKSEVTVIKQSAASLVSMLVGMLAVAVPIVIAIFVKGVSMSFVVVGTTSVIALLNFTMYLYLKTKGVVKFKAL